MCLESLAHTRQNTHDQILSWASKISGYLAFFDKPMFENYSTPRFFTQPSAERFSGKWISIIIKSWTAQPFVLSTWKWVFTILVQSPTSIYKDICVFQKTWPPLSDEFEHLLEKVNQNKTLWFCLTHDFKGLRYIFKKSATGEAISHFSRA